MHEQNASELTIEQIREEINALMDEGNRAKVNRVTILAAEMQRRDVPIAERNTTGQPYGIPTPDKVRIGFSHDDAGYYDSNTAERAYWTLARAGRNPHFHQGEQIAWVKYRA